MLDQNLNTTLPAAQALQPIAQQRIYLLLKKDLAYTWRCAFQGWRRLLHLLKDRHNCRLIILLNILARYTDARTETHINKLQDLQALPPSVFDFLLGKVVGLQKGLPTFCCCTEHFSAYGNFRAKFVEAFTHLVIRYRIVNLMLFPHLPQNQSAADKPLRCAYLRILVGRLGNRL